MNFPLRNPIDSYSEATKLDLKEDYNSLILIPAMLGMGFIRATDNTGNVVLLPCPLGTFSNSSSQGKENCTECPPGML